MNFSDFIASESAKSCHPWIDGAAFDPMPQSEVLSQVLERVRAARDARIAHGGKPVKVVFDLDSTIFDVKPRTLRILKEFAMGAEAKGLSPAISQWAMGLSAHKLLYTLEESAAANGLPEPIDKAKDFFRAAFKFWRKRFFDHAYLGVDHPTPGAVDFVNRVVDAGAVAVYLTGRDWPGMGRGTQSMLESQGFPVDPRFSELIMKPNFGIEDSEFKDAALRELRTGGEAVALFDNEPANFHVFEKNFPEAMLVFYHSNCSSRPAKAVNRIYRIENFFLP